MFADDMNVFFSNKEARVIETVINTEFKKLMSWFRCNKLSLNVNKTKSIIFKTQWRPLSHDMKLYIDNMEIEQVHCMKFLGLLIDESLTWSSHIHEVENKISKNIGVLSCVQKLIKPTELYTLLFSNTTILWCIVMCCGEIT